MIVPSFAHLSPHPILRNRMVERLEHDADALVFELGNL